ncbi:MAG: hypothetical protein HPY30_11470 [Gammaproteobacteria bacterium (ex Lamellibrachia satsuma)]|nr:MAG: hypothetical protein HPY30_11470 [Gammaproteobacteria bacterium (ex Lamellibrachia satsuma)]
MSKGQQQHKCDENWYKDAEVVYSKINVEQYSWVLVQTWYASEHEVSDGMAEKVGDIISSHDLLISFCPFCGERLTDIKPNTW